MTDMSPAPRSPILQMEAELFDGLELDQRPTWARVEPWTVEAIHESAELLCRAYSGTPAAVLNRRARQRLHDVTRCLRGRTGPTQRRGLLIAAGRLSLLVGCLQFELGEPVAAEAIRRSAYRMGYEAGHGEIMAWAYEMTAWFALVDDRFTDAAEAARTGREIAGRSSSAVQLALQQARSDAGTGDRHAAEAALRDGAAILDKLPVPAHPDNHFVFDPAKWLSFAAACYTTLGDHPRAEEHAHEVIRQHRQPDGSTDAPMRTANAHLDLATIHARRGDLDAAIEHGTVALTHKRLSPADRASRSRVLRAILAHRFPDDPRAWDLRRILSTPKNLR